MTTMTEAQWLASDDPAAMLFAYVARGKVSNRKLRLFACSCCRQVWHLLASENVRQAVEVGEAFADGRASKEELAAAWEIIWDGWEIIWDGWERDPPREAHLARECCSGSLAGLQFELEGSAEADLLREVIGNPFWTLPTPRQLSWWITDYRRPGMGIAGMAERIYDERDWEALPVLADRLEDVGCDASIVDHLRSPGPHVRGCWALDLVLAKE